MNKKINTSINIIGGIPNYEIIFHVLGLLAANTSADAIHDIIVTKNKYGIRTEEARSRFLRVIKKAFWQFNNIEHETLIRALFCADELYATKNLTLFWMMGINDILFENITKHAFLKAYFSGRVQIKNDDIIAYLRHERETSTDIQKWSDGTIKTVASKYLTFLKKIDFLKGRQKKEFRYIQVDNNSLIYFIYLIKAVEPDQPDIFKNRYIDYLFTEKSNLISMLKKAVFAGYFDILSTGINLKIDLKLKNEELVDAISSRA